MMANRALFDFGVSFVFSLLFLPPPPFIYLFFIFLVLPFQKEVVNIYHKVCKTIISNHGVVMGLTDHGVATLPYRMRAHLKWHTTGRYKLDDVNTHLLLTRVKAHICII